MPVTYSTHFRKAVVQNETGDAQPKKLQASEIRVFFSWVDWLLL